jgi:hypothetical protein
MPGLPSFGVMYPSPKSEIVSPRFCMRARQWTRTGIEWSRELKSANKLRVEAGSDLNTHAAAEEPDVHDPQVWFLPPSHLVLLHHAGDDGVGSTILSCDETHVGDVRSDGGCEASGEVWGNALYTRASNRTSRYPGSLPQTSVARVG